MSMITAYTLSILYMQSKLCTVDSHHNRLPSSTHIAHIGFADLHVSVLQTVAVSFAQRWRKHLGSVNSDGRTLSKAKSRESSTGTFMSAAISLNVGRLPSWVNILWLFLSIIVFYVISLQDSCLESTQLEWPCWRLYKITSATQTVTDATCTTTLTFYVQKMSSTYIQVMSTDHEYKVHKTCITIFNAKYLLFWFNACILRTWPIPQTQLSTVSLTTIFSKVIFPELRQMLTDFQISFTLRFSRNV